MSAQTRLGSESLAADVAVKWTVLGALYLGIVVSQMLLQVRELNEGASTFGQMTLVRPFAWWVLKKRHFSLVGNFKLTWTTKAPSFRRPVRCLAYPCGVACVAAHGTAV